MAKKYTCGSCDHYQSFEGENRGVCMLLSDVEDNENAPAGGEGQFWVTKGFGCSLHSSKEQAPMPEEPTQEPEKLFSKPSGNRRASDIL